MQVHKSWTVRLELNHWMVGRPAGKIGRESESQTYAVDRGLENYKTIILEAALNNAYKTVSAVLLNTAESAGYAQL